MLSLGLLAKIWFDFNPLFCIIKGIGFGAKSDVIWGRKEGAPGVESLFNTGPLFECEVFKRGRNVCPLRGRVLVGIDEFGFGSVSNTYKTIPLDAPRERSVYLLFNFWGSTFGPAKKTE